MWAPSSSRPAVTPETLRADRSREWERYYVGRRPGATEVYVINGPEIAPLEHPGYRGNAPFDWGAVSAGALELAFALLAHTTDSRPPDLICETFRADVVAGLEHPGFVLTDGEISLWLLTTFADARADDAPRDVSGLRARVAGWLHRRRRRR